MYTIHKSNYTVVKQLHNRNSKVKKINKNISVYRSIKHN